MEEQADVLVAALPHRVPVGGVHEFAAAVMVVQVYDVLEAEWRSID